MECKDTADYYRRNAVYVYVSLLFTTMSCAKTAVNMSFWGVHSGGPTEPRIRYIVAGSPMERGTFRGQCLDMTRFARG